MPEQAFSGIPQGLGFEFSNFHAGVDSGNTASPQPGRGGESHKAAEIAVPVVVVLLLLSAAAIAVTVVVVVFWRRKKGAPRLPGYRFSRLQTEKSAPVVV